MTIAIIPENRLAGIRSGVNNAVDTVVTDREITAHQAYTDLKSFVSDGMCANGESDIVSADELAYARAIWPLEKPDTTPLPTGNGIILDATQFRAATHNGMVTIRSHASGDHRTFKLSTCRSGKLEGKRIVSLLTGPDRGDYANWTGFAFIGDNGAINVWGRYKGTDYAKFATMLAFPERFASRADYMVESACRRCNKPLTHPDSIASGLGPWCRQQGDDTDHGDYADDEEKRAVDGMIALYGNRA